ncbi:hypothetical protein [Flavivirga spongiicola]|uniref:Uncharacterized protein n=1 Tax=Flavivirga spongiicola TaxID=421621 RepID=A0ABU7XXD4_9FLAO|nr:hypothetical protein [Flavivirga sp. MEBiC05379]MDO5980222.1 hypothetical protein [Flavivirga sp. MEBiC05379]
MIKTEVSKLPYTLIRPQYAFMDTLNLLLDRPNYLSDDVKKHCKKALKIIGIIYADLGYDTGTNLLSKKEYDPFFKLFPSIYFNNRELIPVNMIIDNIQLCIKANKIVSDGSE